MKDITKTIIVNGCNDCLFNEQGFCNHPDLVGNKFDQPLGYNNQQTFCPLNNNDLLIIKTKS